MLQKLFYWVNKPEIKYEKIQRRYFTDFTSLEFKKKGEKSLIQSFIQTEKIVKKDIEVNTDDNKISESINKNKMSNSIQLNVVNQPFDDRFFVGKTSISRLKNSPSVVSIKSENEIILEGNKQGFVKKKHSKHTYQLSSPKPVFVFGSAQKKIVEIEPQNTESTAENYSDNTAYSDSTSLDLNNIYSDNGVNYYAESNYPYEHSLSEIGQLNEDLSAKTTYDDENESYSTTYYSYNLSNTEKSANNASDYSQHYHSNENSIYSHYDSISGESSQYQSTSYSDESKEVSDKEILLSRDSSQDTSGTNDDNINNVESGHMYSDTTSKSETNNETDVDKIQPKYSDYENDSNDTNKTNVSYDDSTRDYDSNIENIQSNGEKEDLTDSHGYENSNNSTSVSDGNSHEENQITMKSSENIHSYSSNKEEQIDSFDSEHESIDEEAPTSQEEEDDEDNYDNNIEEDVDHEKSNIYSDTRTDRNDESAEESILLSDDNEYSRNNNMVYASSGSYNEREYEESNIEAGSTDNDVRYSSANED